MLLAIATKNGHFRPIYTKCAFVKFFVKKDVYKASLDWGCSRHSGFSRREKKRNFSLGAVEYRTVKGRD